jgi:CBS domain-containing protein
MVVNVTLVLFNLIPAFPMDGGRVLRAVLAMFMEARRATAMAARVGQAFAFLFALVGLVSTNYILLLVGVFIYIAAASEEQSAAFRGFASGLTVRDAMEPAPVTLSATAPLSQAIEILLASPQREFPVLDGARLAGLLDRNAMLAALRDLGAEVPVGQVMAEVAPISAGEPLVDAFTRMRQRGATAEVVASAGGQVIGILTQENVAEMMMIESARPGWRFQR